MCIKCDLQKTEGIKPLTVSHPAINPDGTRTLWGPYVESDFAAIRGYYPELSVPELREYIDFFEEPRLTELLGPLELLRRMVNKQFSQIRDLALEVAYNPLSILSKVDGKVIRIKTGESELLHRSMEKLSLRTRTLEKINSFFDGLFGVQIAFACSCGVGAVRTGDLEVFLASDYYCQREGLGRAFDSDILGAEGQGSLFHAESIRFVPNHVLQASRDVGEAEVTSYLYYAEAVRKITHAPVKVVHPNTGTFFNELAETA